VLRSLCLGKYVATKDDERTQPVFSPCQSGTQTLVMDAGLAVVGLVDGVDVVGVDVGPLVDGVDVVGVVVGVAVVGFAVEVSVGLRVGTLVVGVVEGIEVIGAPVGV